MMVTHPRSKTTQNYAITEMCDIQKERGQKAKYICQGLRSALTDYIKATYGPKMKGIAKTKCSAVVDRAGGRTGLTGIESG